MPIFTIDIIITLLLVTLVIAAVLWLAITPDLLVEECINCDEPAIKGQACCEKCANTQDEWSDISEECTHHAMCRCFECMNEALAEAIEEIDNMAMLEVINSLEHDDACTCNKCMDDAHADFIADIPLPDTKETRYMWKPVHQVVLNKEIVDDWYFITCAANSGRYYKVSVVSGNAKRISASKKVPVCLGRFMGEQKMDNRYLSSFNKKA